MSKDQEKRFLTFVDEAAEKHTSKVAQCAGRISEARKILESRRQRADVLKTEIAKYGESMKTANPALMGQISDQHEKDLFDLTVLEEQIREIENKVIVSLVRAEEDAQADNEDAIRSILFQEKNRRNQKLEEILKSGAEPIVLEWQSDLNKIRAKYHLKFRPEEDSMMSCLGWKNDPVLHACADYLEMRLGLALATVQLREFQPGKEATARVFPLTPGGGKIDVR